MSPRKYDFVHRHFIDPAPRWRDQRHPVPAVFLDRDGVVNEEVHYLSKIDDLALIPEPPQPSNSLMMPVFRW